MHEGPGTRQGDANEGRLEAEREDRVEGGLRRTHPGTERVVPSLWSQRKGGNTQLRLCPPCQSTKAQALR